MLTFLDCKNSSIPDVSGCCATSTRFANLINDACRRLLRRGDWVGTVTPIQVCVKHGCLVMPRYVQSVRKLNVCHHPMPVGNLWYSFIQHDHCHLGMFSDSWRHAHEAHHGILTAQGQTSCYNDIPGDGWMIRAYPTVADDVGKVATIFGVDNGNQPLRTDNGDGTWSEGWSTTLGLPFTTFTAPNANPNNYVRRIDYAVKEVTQGQVRIFAYNPVSGLLVDLAIWDPGETTPTYTRYNFNHHRTCCGGTISCCDSVQSVVMLVKLRFIPVQFDTDLVIIDNLDALKEMVQAIKLRDQGDLRNSLGFEASAVRELNRDLEDHYPDDQFSAVNNVFGGETFSNQSF